MTFTGTCVVAPLVWWLSSFFFQGVLPTRAQGWIAASAITILLTPVLVLLIESFLVRHRQSKILSEASTYELMKKVVQQGKLLGKTKPEVIALLGNTDINGSRATFNLTPNQAYFRSILEVEFRQGRVVSYQQKEP